MNPRQWHLASRLAPRRLRSALARATLLVASIVSPALAHAASAASTTSAATAAPPFDIAVQRLSPRVAIFNGDPWDNAIVAIATNKGLVVVDAPFSRSIAAGFRQAIRKEFARNDFAYLINTHEHLCHVGGNEAFADLPIVAHDSLRRELSKSAEDPKRVTNALELAQRSIEKMRAAVAAKDPKKLESHGYLNFEKSWQLVIADYRKNPSVVLPTMTFDRDATLHLGDLTVQLFYYGFGHGIADTIVRIPEENLVLTAGIFDTETVPMTATTQDATVAVVDGWFVLMHRLLDEANETTRFVHSHGSTIMHKADIQRSVTYLEALWTEVVKARRAGKTLEEVKRQLPLEAFPAVAELANQSLPGTEWEVLDVHQQNLEHLWSASART